MTSRLYSVLAAVLIASITLFVYRDLAGLWFTDVDTLPLISTSRFDSLESFLRIFSTPVMQGLMPNALFYRPLTSVSWGIDASLWGMNPFGYHLSALAAHIISSVLLFSLLRRTARLVAAASADTRGPSQADWTALLAAILFAIHPVAMEVVPAVARRPDVLYGMFALLTLHSLCMALGGQRVRGMLLATMFAVLAFAAKDTALALPGIAMAYVFCFGHATTLVARLRLCIQLCWPMMLAAGLFLGARIVVLNGMGGYAAEETWAHLPFLTAALTSLKPFLCAIYLPGNLDTCKYVPELPMYAFGLVTLAALLLVGWRTRKGYVPSLAMRFVSFAGICLFAVTLLYALAGTQALVRTLYVALIFVSIAVSWGIVMLASAALKPLRDHKMRIAERGVYALVAILLLGVSGSVLRGAWTGQYIDEWTASAERDKQLFDDLAEHFAVLPADAVVYLLNVPYREIDQDKHPHPFRERPLPMQHSVQGYADLVFPAKRLEIIALSYLRYPGESPVAVESTVSFQPKNAHVEIETGSGATPARIIWWTGLATPSPWHENKYRKNWRKPKLSIDLNPGAIKEGRAVFLVYSGGRFVRQGTDAWVLN